ncbi:MAG: calcium/sodium antiporter [Kosmotoga sp.]|nr:MAG: calcium/sodium antiporter [Kosmotoga sp.]
MILNVILLLVGVILLVKGADFLVEGSAAISKKLGVSELFIGLTVVAFGTSAPELAVSVSASIKGSGGIAIANVLGSNIANVALVLGFTAIISPIAFRKSTFRSEIPFVILASISTGMLLLNDNYVLDRFEAVILLAFFVIFMDYLFSMAKKDRKFKNDLVSQGVDKEDLSRLERNTVLAWISTLGGIIAVVAGGNFVVNSGTYLANSFGVSETLIGVTIIAVGTSLPELVTSIAATLKRSQDMAVGNILGSNIFNLLLVLGTASSIKPIQADRPVLIDIIIATSLVILLPFISFRKKRLGRIGGIILFSIYIFYIYNSIVLG